MAKIREIFSKLSETNLGKLVFLVLILLLPIQTRLVYFTQNSQAGQSFVFYDTAFLYVTDLLIFTLGVIWIFGLIFQKFHVEHQGIWHICLVFIAFLAFNLGLLLFVSYQTNLTLALFGLFKLFSLFILFCFITNIYNVKQLLNISFWLILATSLFQIVIGIYQYFLQKSLGLKLLGEEYLRYYLPGLAKFKMLNGYHWIFDKIFHVSHETLVIRAYGTFSHANVFGAFMFVAVLVSCYLFYVSYETWKKVLVASVIFLQVFGLTISFSRAAIAAGLLAVFVFFFLMLNKKIPKGFSLSDNQRKKLKFLAAIIALSFGICFILFYPQFLERSGIVSYGTSNKEALDDRLLYQKISLEMIKKHPLTGVGFQNFVSVMDEYSPVVLKDNQHQPVHNVYLLIAAETGLVGLGIFLLFLALIIRRVWNRGLNPISAILLSVFIGFLFLGLFDHYLWTIQQGKLMFFIFSGFLLASTREDFAEEGRIGNSIEKYYLERV